MQAVSSAWKEAHRGMLLPEMFIEITYAATEPGLQEEAVATSPDEATISDTRDIVSEQRYAEDTYASLEHGMWGLDGSYDHTIEHPGYVSESICGENGLFGTNPTVSITLASLHMEPIPGLTITWSTAFNEWAEEFRVRAYSGNSLVTQTSVSGNKSVTSVVRLNISDYNRIEIEIVKWSMPHRRARCSDVFLGIETVYTKSDLMGYDHSQSVDLLSAALPKNEIVFRMRNEDNRWNPDNPTGIEQYLLEQQEVRVRYGMTVDGEIEWIKGGTFWLSEWNTPANGLEATFTARDAVGFMEVAYEGSREGTMYEIAEAALIQADIPVAREGGSRYYLSDCLKEYRISLGDGEYTISQVLQMIAHAGCCVFYQDRDGVTHIEPWANTYQDYMIDQHNSYAHPEYTISKPLKAVSVGYGGESSRYLLPVQPKGEVQTVDNEFIQSYADAQRVAERTREVLENRRVVTGDFRADVRLDALDPVIVTSKYATGVVAVTDIVYSTTGGGFRGTYTGRVIPLAVNVEERYSGEFYAGEYRD